MKILVTSDWHLDWETAGLERFSDVAWQVEKTVAAAIARKVDLYLFAGDLCNPDANRAPRCMAYAISVFQQLERTKIPSRWVTGNHDVIEDGSGTSTLMPLAAAGAQVISEPGIETIGGCCFAWLPYVPRCKDYDAEAMIETFDWLAGPVIVTGHLAIEQLDPGNCFEHARGRSIVMPVDKICAKWASRALIVNGHYHKRTVDHSVLCGGLAVPGSLERLTFGEQDNRPGFLVVDVDNSGKEESKPSKKKPPKKPLFACEEVELPSRPVFTLDASSKVWSREGKVVPTGTDLADDDFIGELPPLVRLRPPAGTPPEWITSVCDMVKSKGAGAVKVIAPLTTAQVAVIADESLPPGANAPRKRAREVVEALVEESCVGDKESLRALVEDVMSKEEVE